MEVTGFFRKGNEYTFPAVLLAVTSFLYLLVGDADAFALKGQLIHGRLGVSQLCLISVVLTGKDVRGIDKECN
ncbi:hypothetical protein J6590_035920 [Homalodisca vitripennis]|nr:hypothetical protein J6590_035920 [Homalodisca vitripennis]